VSGLCHAWSTVDKSVSRRHTGAMNESPKRRPFKILPFGPDVAAPREFPFLVEEEGLYSLDFEVVYEQPIGGQVGTYVCNQRTIPRPEDGPPVTSGGIRQIPVAALLRLAFEGNLMHVGPTIYEEGGGSSWELTWA